MPVHAQAALAKAMPIWPNPRRRPRTRPGSIRCGLDGRSGPHARRDREVSSAVFDEFGDNEPPGMNQLYIVVSRALDFPISCATIEPNEWFSGRCLAPRSPADDLPEQQIAAAQAICDQARALIGDTLGQDPMESAEWRTHVYARYTILAAGNAPFRTSRRSTMGRTKP